MHCLSPAGKYYVELVLRPTTFCREMRTDRNMAPICPGFTLRRPLRSGIAHRPAAGLDQRDKTLDHFVEQGRLLEIEHMAGLREERQPGGGQMPLQEQARLDAGVVFVAADDQRRRR